MLFVATALAADLTFVVTSDMQTDGDESSINFDVFPQLVEDMSSHDPDVGVFPGDLVGGASTVSDAREVRFYVDGVQHGAAQDYARAPTGGGRGMVYLGADTEGSGSYELAGALDEVCVFDQVLDAKQVGALATRTDCAEIVPEPEEDPGDTDAVEELPDDTGESAGDDTSSSGGDGGDGGVRVDGEGTCGCGGASPASLLWLAPLVLARRRT